MIPATRPTGTRVLADTRTVTADVYTDDVNPPVAPATATATRHGRAAADLLAGHVRDLKRGEPLAPVTVVVPSNYAAVAARRDLARRDTGVANVTFLTLHRLAERLGGPVLAGAGRRPAATPVVAAAVRAILAADPGVLAPVADHPATEQALVTAHRELATASDAALDAVAACSERAYDVVRIHRAIGAELAAAWYEEQDLLVAAADALQRDGARDIGPVVVHLLDDLTAADAHLLHALAITTTVRIDVGVTGDDTADAAVLAAYHRAGIDVRAHGDAPTTTPAHATRIVSTSDPDDEVRAAVRLVEKWAHDGTALGRVALLYGTPDPYARLLHEHLSAAGVPFNGAPVRAAGDLLLGRSLRALLALPDRGMRRADVLAVLAGAPVLDDGGRRVENRAWERISREAGIVGDDEWAARLDHFATDARRRAAVAETDGRDALAAHLRRDADRADDLARFVARLRRDLAAGDDATTWDALATWATALVDRYLGGEHRRVTWPDDEQRAAERVDAAIDRLAHLDEIGGPTPDVDVFRRTLDAELENAVRRVGRTGEGVLVGHVSLAAGLVLDRVVVLGMAEGSFPARRLDDSLLPDAEREAAKGEIRLRADRVHDDRRHLLIALDAADEAVLSQPRGDLRRAGERPASRWLLADAARLANASRPLRSDELARHRHADWFDHVDSFAGGLARLTLPATEQDLRLAAIARDDTTHPALTRDATLTAALDTIRARRSSEFTRFDGNLAVVAATGTAEIGPPARTSASRLETWAACPHSYLLEYVLGVDVVEEPERRFEMSPLDKGSLVHDILDEFVTGAIDGGHPLDRWTDADRDRLHRVAAEHFTHYEAEGLTGRALFWRRDRTRLLADLDRFLVEDNDRLAAGLRPIATELHFADVPLPLPSGHTLLVRGSIDRVDRAPDGSLVVVDYKTGSTTSYAALKATNPHVGGTHLQLYLYAVAARHALGVGDPVDAYYWFTSAKGGFKKIGYPVTPEIADGVCGAVDTIVSSIAAGVFPARPSEKPAFTWVDCWFCTPDGLGAADRRREWERKRRDPALARYVALAEPDAEADA